MANSLLDFVMSLVSDPDAAAHYADDPGQAIADAHLTDVTSADVNHLIPVVAESMSSAMPTTGHDSFGADAGSNVWASGAATAAFDAFGDHLPQQVVDDPHGVITDLVGHGIDDGVVNTAMSALDVPTVADVDHPAMALHTPVIDDVPIADASVDPGWVQDVHDVAEDHHLIPEDIGYDDLI